MAKDPYEILGIKRTATEAEIGTAYRKLAKQYHPDLNPGKADAEEQFKALTAAHAMLADAEQRAQFDRGEIDASGQERAQPRDFYRDFGDDTRRTRYRSTQGRDSGAGYDGASFHSCEKYAPSISGTKHLERDDIKLQHIQS